MIRVRIRSLNVYGWLGRGSLEADRWHIVGDDGVNYLAIATRDIEHIGRLDEEDEEQIAADRELAEMGPE